MRRTLVAVDRYTREGDWGGGKGGERGREEGGEGEREKERRRGEGEREGWTLLDRNSVFSLLK